VQLKPGKSRGAFEANVRELTAANKGKAKPRSRGQIQQRLQWAAASIVHSSVDLVRAVEEYKQAVAKPSGSE
jgi:hypothetical protein